MKKLITRSLGTVLALGVFAAPTTAGAQVTAPPPPPPLEPWYDAFDFRAFVDAYASVNYNFPKPQRGTNGPTRAFDTDNGFALSWAGFDASYEADPVGGTVNLRFGPTAEVVAGPDADTTGLQYVKQAYATWKPGGPESRWTLDFGKMDTIVGGELAESQDNFNYTRGLIFNLAQPFFHTGFRAGVEVLPELSITALAVNGWGNTIDNNQGKTFGLQLGVTPSDMLGFSVGWIGGPEQDDFLSIECDPGEAFDPAAAGCAPAPGAPGGTETVDRGGANDPSAWRHLVDVVVTVDATERLAFAFNGDLGIEGTRTDDATGLPVEDTTTWWGFMVAARYQLTEHFALAGRYEYLDDKDGFAVGVDGLVLGSAALTLEATPTDNLVLRLETRGDFALESTEDGGKDIFQKNERDFESSLDTTTLGVVVTTN